MASERGERVRQALRAAAVELIPELGWYAVSTRALAERAGVAPGLVHYHFDSVQALLRVAAVDVLRSAVAGFVPALARAGDLAGGLDAMLGALDPYSGTDPLSLLAVETYLAATRDPLLHAELRTLVTELRAELATWLRGHGVPFPEPTAAVLAAAIDGVMLHRALRPDLDAATTGPVLRRLLIDHREGPDEQRSE